MYLHNFANQTVPGSENASVSRSLSRDFIFITQDAAMDFATGGCVHVLDLANRLLQSDAYSWTLLKPADLQKGERPICGPDQTLVLVGGTHALWDLKSDQLRLLKDAIRNAMRVCVVGSAAFLPWVTGVLGAKRMAVHMSYQTGLAELYPTLEIQSGATHHHKSLSSATGPAAAMRMMVELVGARDGDVAAMALSRDLGLTDSDGPCASGEHLKFQRMSQGDEVIHAALQMMEDHLEDTLSVAQIAEIIGVSPRKLERCFGERLGRSPLKVYRDLRLHRAHSLLTQTALPLGEVSVACGFSNVTSMKRWFHEKYGQLPCDVRKRAFAGTA